MNYVSDVFEISVYSYVEEKDGWVCEVSVTGTIFFCIPYSCHMRDFDVSDVFECICLYLSISMVR